MITFGAAIHSGGVQKCVLVSPGHRCNVWVSLRVGEDGESISRLVMVVGGRQSEGAESTEDGTIAGDRV